jgi:feruloyl-CoA synthase
MSHRIPLSFGPPGVVVEKRGDGALLVSAEAALGYYPRAVTDWLAHWARTTPDRTYLAERTPAGAWRKVTYANVWERARSVAQALIDRGLDEQRPVAILSGNSVDHAIVGFGAMLAGVPYAPVSPPYSLVAKDYGKLRAIIAVLTPGLVFVDDAAPFARAIDAVVGPDVEIVAVANLPSGRRATSLAEIYATPATSAVDAAHARVTADTTAKLLFTSGSTGAPKGVINTHRMMTSNQAMLRSLNPSFGAEATVLLDWLPWSHTFGGNNNFNLVLSNGGSFYIDEGRPLPKAIDATARNLREISPTVYYNVPKGFEMLLPLLQSDAAMRRGLFAKLQAFVYAGAALSPHVRSELERLGREETGVAIPMLTSLGSTETGPSAISVTEKTMAPGVVGIPNPGVVLKLLPNLGKWEARLKSPSIMPGYWRLPDLSAAAFDEEGFYKLGDALKFVDDSDPELGLLFDGRVGEDFKLATGTWVSVGPMRQRFVAHCAPYVTDLVIAGHDKDDAAALVVPNYGACRALDAELDREASYSEIVSSAPVRETFARLLASFNKGAGGSSERFKRILLLGDPPSLDSGELTDKGSINQRAALSLRVAEVAELYAEQPSARRIG